MRHQIQFPPIWEQQSFHAEEPGSVCGPWVAGRQKWAAPSRLFLQWASFVFLQVRAMAIYFCLPMERNLNTLYAFLKQKNTHTPTGKRDFWAVFKMCAMGFPNVCMLLNAFSSLWGNCHMPGNTWIARCIHFDVWFGKCWWDTVNLQLSKQTNVHGPKCSYTLQRVQPTAALI